MMLVLRRYEPSDVQAVWALHQLASQAAGVPTPEPYCSDLHDVESAFLNHGGASVVGAYEGQIVAMGGLKRTACDRAENTRMRVHLDFQRQRFGSAILRHLEKRAAELGYKTLHLDTSVVQEAAQQFYLRHGYRCVGRGHKEAFEVVFFEKKLEAAQAEAEPRHARAKQSPKRGDWREFLKLAAVTQWVRAGEVQVPPGQRLASRSGANPTC